MTIESIYELAIEQHNKWTKIREESNVKTQKEANDIQMKRLDSFRLSLEPHIYHYLIEKHGPKLEQFWQTYTPPKKANRAFVIVERRSHQNFWFILRNIAWSNPEMSVYIFCSDENVNFVKSFLGDKLSHFNLVIAFKGEASRERGKKEVDNLLSNYKVYDFIDAEYIMTVEMDTFFRRKVPETIFTGTYWGNPWAWTSETPGGGGVTIRNVKKVSEHCRKLRPDPTIDLHTAQDAWLSDSMFSEKAEFPDLSFRANYIMENINVHNPVAVHQFWTYLDSYNILDKDKFIAHITRILSFEY